MKKLNTFKKYLTPSNLDLTLTGSALVIGMYLNWQINYVIIFTCVIWLILRPVRLELLVKINLLLIFLIPVSQASKKADLAQDLGVAVYVFLILIIFKCIFDLEKKTNI